MDEITTLGHLDTVLSATAEHPAFIFKHSTACPVSAGALRRTREFIEKSHAAGAELPPCYLIKVIESRPISNAFAQRPPDPVEDVALPGPVGTDDGGDAGMELELGSVGEGLETHQFQMSRRS